MHYFEPKYIDVTFYSNKPHNAVPNNDFESIDMMRLKKVQANKVELKNQLN